jgi:nucleoside-diphosphate-sugar epimerase
VDQLRVLVTGAASGLGRHCCEAFRAVPYTRESNYETILEEAKAKPFDVIIHAAFNVRSNIDTENLHAYLNDTTFLTQKLLAIPHKKFIFISSVDVYPKDDHAHHEDEVIRLNEVDSIYSISKLMSESLVAASGHQPLILRPTAMLGAYAKPNSLMKILHHDRVSLTLASHSTFNYIRHSDVTDFIHYAINKQLHGIFNVAASSDLQLGEVSKHFNKPVTFGNYVYKTASADNHKISALFPCFKRTSMDNIKLYMNDLIAKEGEPV